MADLAVALPAVTTSSGDRVLPAAPLGSRQPRSADTHPGGRGHGRDHRFGPGAVGIARCACSRPGRVPALPARVVPGRSHPDGAGGHEGHPHQRAELRRLDGAGGQERRFKGKLADAQTAFASDLKSYDALGRNGKQSAQLRDAYAGYVAGLPALMAAGDDKDFVAYAAARAKVVPLATEIDKVIAALVDKEIRTPTRMQTGALQQARDSQRLVLGLLLVGLSAAMALGLMIARACSEPLRACRTCSAGIAKGDLTGHADVFSRDELGQMAAALNTAHRRRCARYGRVVGPAGAAPASCGGAVAASLGADLGRRRRRPRPRPASSSRPRRRSPATCRPSPRAPRRWAPRSGRSPRTPPRPREVAAQAVTAAADHQRHRRQARRLARPRSATSSR